MGGCTPDEFGGVKFGSQGPIKHEYKAYLNDESIQVVDANGDAVEVTIGGTPDGRTRYAYVKGVGFIGGWRYPHRKMPRSYLVDCINKGILYLDMNELPTRTEV